MVTRDKILTGVLIALLIIAFLYAVRGILFPFIIAFIIAYFLDPAADKLVSWGCSRGIATLLIMSFFFLIFIGGIVFIAPFLYKQVVEFAHALPDYIRYFNDTLVNPVLEITNDLDKDTIEKAQESLQDVSGSLLAFFIDLIKNIWSSGLALVNLISLIFITPIVTFYTLRDWDKMIEKIATLIPPKHRSITKKIAVDIDNTLAGYLRGQMNVCLILATFYGLCLTLLDLNFGLFIGVATGILSFIPYVGVAFGFFVGVLIAIFQFDTVYQIALVAGVFIIGQVIEGNFITPKLIGNKVGLHPAWIIFGMLAGAVMFGFTGILLAIPVTAVIGVLIKHALYCYQYKLLDTNPRHPE